MQSRWFARVRRIMEWNEVSRASLPLFLLVPLYGLYLAWAELMLRLPGGQAVLNRAAYAQYAPFIVAAMAGSAGLFGLGLLLRRLQPHSRWFQHLAANYYGFSLVLGGYLTGSLSMATGAVLMGAPIVGFLLLERAVVLVAVGLAFVAVLGLNLAAAWGALPYAPLLLTPVDTRSALLWTASQFFFVAPFMLSALTQVYTLVGYWREREARALALSLTDALTGVHNRRSVLDILGRELAHAWRHPQALSLVLLDLDHFKKINDSHGHPAGDRVLAAVAQALQARIRPGDAIGRFGGEEFLLVLPGATPAQAAQVVERCRAALAALELRADDGSAIPVRGSFGLAWMDAGQSARAEDLVHAADRALYQAKAGGRDRLVAAPGPCHGNQPPAALPPERAPRNWRDLRTLLAGILEWSPVAKTCLILAMLLGAGIVFRGYLGYVLMQPGHETMVNAAVIERLLAALPLALLTASALLAAGLLLRRRQPGARWFQVLGLGYFGTAMVGVGYTVGILYIPTGAMLLCSALLGFILFERRLVLALFSLCLLAVVALAFASALGLLPYAPMLAHRAGAWQSTSPFWVLSNYFFVCWAMPIALLLTDHVLGHWRAREAEVQALSQTDALTRVGNRRFILEQLDRELRRARRHQQPLTVVILDLDLFKKINDSFGHPTGDRVLQTAARVLRETLREGDAVGRYGGEEFMLLLRDTGHGGAAALLERCRQALRRSPVLADNGEKVPLSASFGYASTEGAPEAEADTLIRAADQALYRAKAGGRNRVEAAPLALDLALQDRAAG